VAQVAGDSARAAALDELAAALAGARAEGRLIERLPASAIDAAYLGRDRLAQALDPDEPQMAALMASLAAHGQQSPIEVVDLAPPLGPRGAGHPRPRYGLIAGWRRLTALCHLAGGAEATVLAIVRPPRAAAEAWRAMVEENEIRADLSYWERARIVDQAVKAQVYPDDRAALQGLFGHATAPRRSKIGSFLRVVRALEGHLRHPAHLNERLGLALAAGLDRDPSLAQRLISALQAAAPALPQAEMAVIAGALKGRVAVRGQPAGPGLQLTVLAADRVQITGAGLADPACRARLAAWLAQENSL
jgi:hypothetical protein